MPNFAADVETLGISAHLCFANFQHIWRCNLASYSNRRDDRMAGSMALQCSMRLSRGTLGSHQVTIHGGGIMGEPWRTFNWLILHDFYRFFSFRKNPPFCDTTPVQTRHGIFPVCNSTGVFPSVPDTDAPDKLLGSPVVAAWLPNNKRAKCSVTLGQKKLLNKQKTSKSILDGI